MTGRSPTPSNVIPFRAKAQPVLSPVDVALLNCGAELVKRQTTRAESPSDNLAVMAEILAGALHTPAGRDMVEDLVGRLLRALDTAQPARRTAARGFRAPDAPAPAAPPRFPPKPAPNRPSRRSGKSPKPSNPGSDAV